MSVATSAIPFTPYYDSDGITIYNADCRQVLPFLPRFDLLLTDPPYGIGADDAQHSAATQRINAIGKSKAGRGWKLYEKTNWDSERPSRLAFELMLDCSEDAIIWGGNYFIDFLPPSMGFLIWDKGQRDFSLADCELAWRKAERASRIFDYARSKALQDGRVHPTQKPLALMRWCLSLVPDAQTILDPFMGSGTTLVAAKLEGRKAVGIEINEAYCESAAKRLSQGTLF